MTSETSHGIQRMETKLPNASTSMAVDHNELARLRDEIARLERQVAALRMYVAHRHSCRVNGRAWRDNHAGPCDCGLAAVLGKPAALPATALASSAARAIADDDDGPAIARIIENAQWP